MMSLRPLRAQRKLIFHVVTSEPSPYLPAEEGGGTHVQVILNKLITDLTLIMQVLDLFNVIDAAYLSEWPTL